jgi:glucose-1-phosphate cytidylyltransferase
MKKSEVPIFILCGGLGTRMKEETEFKPKPMVEIGGRPIICHIMKCYAKYGFNHFVLCVGFKSECIKDYFLNRSYFANDFSVKSGVENVKILSSNKVEDWYVDLVDTGTNCMTGARIAIAYDKYYSDRSIFGVTYGDGICDVDIQSVFDFHQNNGAIATITGVNPVSRFGELKVEGSKVIKFLEKPVLKQQWINGGYFFFNSEFRDYITTEEDCVLEQGPLKNLSRDGELRMYQHTGFWSCMDTQRDKEELEYLYANDGLEWLK